MPTTLELLDKAASDLRAAQEENEQLKLQLQAARNESPNFTPIDLTKAMKHIGRNIRFLRKKKGFSTDGFAKLCRIAPQTVSNIEHGRNRPSWTTLEKITNALQVDLFEDIVNSPLSDDCVIADKEECTETVGRKNEGLRRATATDWWQESHRL